MKINQIADVEREIKTRSTPEADHEIAWELGDEHHVTHGNKESIAVKSNNDNWVVHTHPVDEPSEFSALPSEQDLRTLADNQEIPGIVIISGDYYTILRRSKENISVVGYNDALYSNDIEKILMKLRNMGFEVKIGSMR